MSRPAADPATAALTALLVGSAPQDAAPSPLRQLAHLLETGLVRLGDLLAAVRGRADTTPAAPVPATGDVDAPARLPFAPMPMPMPLQPPPPPRLTFNPDLGTIVDLPNSDASVPIGAAPDVGAGADGDHTTLLPSSWVPIVGMFTRRSIATGARALVDRIASLLDELGVTRLQLLLLTLVVPVALAFLISVVADLLG